MTRVYFIHATLALLLISSTARAQHADEDSPWYGWQTLSVDALSLTTALGGIFLSTRPWTERPASNKFLIYSGIGAYVFGAPIVHAAHHQTGKAIGSLLLRSIPPLI